MSRGVHFIGENQITRKVSIPNGINFTVDFVNAKGEIQTELVDVENIEIPDLPPMLSFRGITRLIMSLYYRVDRWIRRESEWDQIVRLVCSGTEWINVGGPIEGKSNE